MPPGVGVDDICGDDTIISAHLQAISSSHTKKALSNTWVLLTAMNAGTDRQSRDMSAMNIAIVTAFKTATLEDISNEMSQTNQQLKIQKVLEHTSSQIETFKEQKSELEKEKRSIKKGPNLDSLRKAKSCKEPKKEIKMKATLVTVMSKN